MNVGSPNSIRWLLIAEGGGDVRSTDDTRDNITRKEGRDITPEKRFEIKVIQQNWWIVSNQDRVQQEIEKLSQKKRKQLTSKERVRLLQLKLYHKAKQEKEYKFYVLYDISGLYTGRSL